MPRNREPQRRRRRSRGQSLVETALVIPIFVMLLLGLFDLGHVIYVQHTVAEAVREAARLAIAPALMDQTKFDAIRARARAAAPGVTIADSDIYGANGACPGANDSTTPGDCFYPAGIGSGDPVEVHISVHVDLLTPVIAQIVGNTFNITVSTVMYQI